MEAALSVCQRSSLCRKKRRLIARFCRLCSVANAVVQLAKAYQLFWLPVRFTLPRCLIVPSIFVTACKIHTSLLILFVALQIGLCVSLTLFFNKVYSLVFFSFIWEYSIMAGKFSFYSILHSRFTPTTCVQIFSLLALYAC